VLQNLLHMPKVIKLCYLQPFSTHQRFSLLVVSIGYHTVLVCMICPLDEGDCLRKLLIFKKCTFFGLVSLFYLIFSNNIRKRVEATNDLEFYFYFPGQKFRTTLQKVNFCVASLLQSLSFAHRRHEYNLIHDFYTYCILMFK